MGPHRWVHKGLGHPPTLRHDVPSPQLWGQSLAWPQGHVFEQTPGTGCCAKSREGSANICCALPERTSWSKIPWKKGKGSGLHHHPNFSEVFPTLQPPRHSSEPPRLPHASGEGMAFEPCVWLVWALVSSPGLTKGSAVHRHLR